MMRSGRNTRSAVTGANSGTITRTGTRLTTPVSKPKPCIVRIEKIGQKKSESEDEKKPIGSARNRINQTVKRTPDRQSVQQTKSVEKLKNKSPITPIASNIMAGRSKRTPKPNPKYQNDSLITSFKGKIGKSDEEDDDDENIEEHFKDSGESDEEFKLDGEDKVSSDDETKSITKTLPIRGQIKGKLPTGNHPSLIQFSTSSSGAGGSNSNATNRARQNLRNAIGSGSIKIDSTTKTTNTPDMKKLTPVVARSRQDIATNLLRKRKMEFEKERVAERKRFNMGLSDSSDTEKSPAHTQKETKTNISKQSSGRATPPTQQGQSNKLLTLSGNKTNQQITTKSSQSMSSNKSVSELTQLNRQKQISLNGKNLIQKTTPSPSSIKIINKKPIEIDDSTDPIGGSGTQDDDDFEQMPTFTIVNINDIIGKKGDVLIEKSSNDVQTKKSNEVISLSPPSRFNNNNNNDNNRRKTMHTTILTDKTDNKLNKSIALTKRGQQTVSSVTKNLINNNNLTKTLSKSSISLSTTTSNQSSTITQSSKGPPRILNTGINKKLSPIITSKTSGSMYSKSNNENEKLLKNNEKLKENLQTSSTTTSGSAVTSPSNSLLGKRKLPSEKVIIQRQGNKIIKKITCFETWYVINIPEQKQLLPQQKNILDISLIKIANSIKTIQLPSNEWTCKVSLQKMNGIQLANAKAKNLEQFTGDVGDPTIKDNEKYKYHPVNVMFRRNSIVKNNRMPYDRAVIFKNGMFFTNIEGKNVKLIDSPQLIKSLQDIEILLQIVNDMSLVSQFVEPATVIP